MFKTKRPDHFSEKSKQDFILFLDEWMSSLHLKGVMIFDSNARHARDYPTKSKLSCLEIIHSPIDLDGDLYILEYISTLKNRHEYQLVTSDNQLTRLAKTLGISALTSNDFFSLLGEKSLTKKRLRDDLKPLFDSKKELERLQKIFESNS